MSREKEHPSDLLIKLQTQNPLEAIRLYIAAVLEDLRVMYRCTPEYQWWVNEYKRAIKIEKGLMREGIEFLDHLDSENELESLFKSCYSSGGYYYRLAI